MNDKVIVTIDREFGSGGHEVAKRLAERLGVPFYDEEIIARAAESTGYNTEYIRDNDEKAPSLIKEPLHYEAIKVQTRNYKN